jgi:cyclopropane-fatty-acyl-phospholipid synthase
MTITDPKVVRAIAKNVSLGVGESYTDGTLRIDGPLDEFVDLAENNPALGAARFAKYMRFHKNVKAKQRGQIAHHYDLGNDFYGMWLDTQTRAYSCAYYKTPADTLEQAQVQKLDHVLRKLQLQPGQTLLDIGCGWGALLIKAAKEYKAKGLGVTLSKEQYEFAVQRARKEKVDHLVEFQLMNYQDVPGRKQQFDRVVSIGFLEHVGEGSIPTYFKVLQKVLKPGGVSVLHSITTLTPQPTDPWIEKHIFPGGYIPSIGEVTGLLLGQGFVMRDFEDLAPHYALTLREWWRRFEDHKGEVIGMFDESFYRMWRLYLVSAACAFEGNTLHLGQWIFTNGPAKGYPLTRDYIYPNRK